MVTASTHDTKRSADVRARIAALSEVPDLWRETIRAIGIRLDDLVGAAGHDPVLDHLLVQTLVGAAPITADRVTASARTAAREALRTTSWLRAEARLDEVAAHLVHDRRCTELLDALAEKVVTLDKVKKDELPEELRKLSADELKTHVEKMQKDRAELQKRITELSKERDTYIDAERKKLAKAGKGDGFDEQVSKSLRSQAKKKGIVYE
jgi:hypothetical protein